MSESHPQAHLQSAPLWQEGGHLPDKTLRMMKPPLYKVIRRYQGGEEAGGGTTRRLLLVPCTTDRSSNETAGRISHRSQHPSSSRLRHKEDAQTPACCLCVLRCSVSLYRCLHSVHTITPSFLLHRCQVMDAPIHRGGNALPQRLTTRFAHACDLMQIYPT